MTWPLEPVALERGGGRARAGARGRGEARPDREPGQGAALPSAAAAGDRGQAGRGGRAAAAEPRPSLRQPDRHRHRRAAAGARRGRRGCARGWKRCSRPSSAAAGFTPAMLRLPYFCPGCPHSSSTHVPEGSKALAGIGCHFMVQWMDRDTSRFTQMGGRGRFLAGRGAVQHPPAHVPERRRRHLLPLRARWRCAPPWRPAPTSPSRSSTTTRSP